MNIFSSKQFENHLAENSFPEKSKYRILLASQLIFGLSSLLGSSMNLNVKYIFFITIHNMLCLIIIFIGVKKCYSINKRIDSTNFIERFILLFFPIGLNFILFVTIIYLIIWAMIQKVLIYLEFSVAIINNFNKFFPYFASLFIVSIFYSLLYRSFLRLEQKIKAMGVGEHEVSSAKNE